MEDFAHHERWIFFWGLLGTEEIDVPSVTSGFNLGDEVAGKFSTGERVVDLTVEEESTLPGVITGIFTIGIVSQREVTVKGRRAYVTETVEPAPAR